MVKGRPAFPVGTALMVAAIVMAISLVVGVSAKLAYASTIFTVNSALDPGTGGCDDTECTLREAINAANGAAGTDTINFDVTGPGCVDGACTISPSSELPIIADPVIINGYSQPEASPATNTSNAVLKIKLDGNVFDGTVDTGNGLKIETNNSTVKGLVISNWGSGIFLYEVDATGNKVQGNFIGTDASGSNLSNNIGVALTNALNNTIGGTDAAARNIISGNGNNGSNPLTYTLSGVEVQFANTDLPSRAKGNRILSNSIYDNARLGIDLYYTNDSPGVTDNDLDPPPDSDDGPNHLQNFPSITSAKLTTRRIRGHRRRVTVIRGTLDSEAAKTYNVQFFSSPTADASGYGEGKRFLGQESVITDGSGDASFIFITRKRVPRGQVVTATATNQSTGDTSEFSRAKPVT